MAERPILVVGSNNRKKAAELVTLLEPLGIEVRTLVDYPDSLTVDEDGETFLYHATKKAVEQAQHLKTWVLADDSGICIDALDGRPGVHSAYFAGPEATDEENNAKLLRELIDVPEEKRTAHYVCYVVLSDPEGNVCAHTIGKCEGRILWEEQGEGGFGYDPLFEIPEYGKTFGVLPAEIKHQLSHRGKALRAMVPHIQTHMLGTNPA
ncbi:dITP/XTP pyrophosphatase [Planctomycetales bacterium 10988]|nr:dITP/XTP pyrophosphatase [Planctomycetales bacterium 10988]